MYELTLKTANEETLTFLGQTPEQIITDLETYIKQAEQEKKPLELTNLDNLLQLVYTPEGNTWQLSREDMSEELPGATALRAFLRKVKPCIQENPVYLLAKPYFSADYLGFGALVCAKWEGAWCVKVGENNAEWQLGRLMSGLKTVAPEIFPTLDKAKEAANQLVMK